MTDLSHRSFLATLAATAAGIFVPRDAERVYLFPPTPTIWTPPPKVAITGAATYSGIQLLTVWLPRDPDVITIRTPDDWRRVFRSSPPESLFAPLPARIYTIPAVGS